MTHMVSLIKLIQKPPEALILSFYWVQQCINTCDVSGQVFVNQLEVRELHLSHPAVSQLDRLLKHRGPDGEKLRLKHRH